MIKITKEKEEGILKEYENIKSSRKVAKLFEVSKPTVLSVLHRHNKIERIKYEKRTINQNYFEKIDNEDAAYFLGFIFADGSVRKRIDGYELSIELNTKDAYILEKFVKSLNSSHIVKKRKNRDSVNVSICNKKIVTDLFKYGCVPRKSLILTFPKQMIKSKHLNHFIRGYFDGDGTIYVGKKDKFFYLLGTFSFLNSIQEILIKNCGINKTKISFQKKSNIYRLVYGGKHNVEKIKKFLYSNASIFLDRKKNKFDV